MNKYSKLTQTAVTNFIYCGKKWLFLKRGPNKKIDANKLNGVGGRLEENETFLDACIRETKEETGYIVDKKDITLSGVVRLIGGYEVNWVMCFFRTKVNSIKIPTPPNKEDGKLVWINQEEIKMQKFELVDDINYCFEKIIDKNEPFFMNAKLNNNQKITNYSINNL
ncbi:MAG: NUDIX domain-containing protein [Candidatus Delongbacteria bacterium]|nr:NUDIX domain-containing protein [Candidatus Delongbacteria bacterium]